MTELLKLGVRLGIVTGVLRDVELPRVNELFVLTQTAQTLVARREDTDRDADQTSQDQPPASDDTSQQSAKKTR